MHTIIIPLYYSLLLCYAILPTAGVRGEPGALDTSKVATRLLDAAIASTNKYPPHVIQTGDCRLLLRDAKLLLNARRFRLSNMWSHLLKLLEAADDIQSGGGGGGGGAEKDMQEAWERKVQHTERIIDPVWQELQLMKYDAMFHSCLSTFADEMMREEEMYSLNSIHNSNSSTNNNNNNNTNTNNMLKVNRKNSMLVTKGLTNINESYTHEQTAMRASRAKTLLDTAREYAEASKGTEFHRLVEALQLAYELRTFAHLNPHRSPSDIIRRAAVVKKRDMRDNLSSYISLLIYDISKFSSNVLDFPLNLNVIRSEIARGRRYCEEAIGVFNTAEIKIEIINTAYQAALPSLDIMGSDADHVFMKLAGVIIKIRQCIIDDDIDEVHDLIERNDELLQNPLVVDEVSRLRSEYENHRAMKLIEEGLRQGGRYLNVVIIAKLVDSYDKRMTRADYRVDIDNVDHNDHEDHSDPESFSFINGVIESVSLLNRAVNIVEQVS